MFHIILLLLVSLPTFLTFEPDAIFDFGQEESTRLNEGNLDVKETKARLMFLFNKIDTSGNGQIDKPELTAWLETHFQKSDRKEAKDGLEKIDDNGDDHVSFDEYVSNAYGYTLTELKKMREDPSTDAQHFLASIDEEEDKFSTADNSQDGLLDLVEFAAFQNPYHYSRMAPHTAKETIRFLDKDGNGQLSETEYVAMEAESGEVVENEKERFKEIDEDGSGEIDKDELARHFRLEMKKHAKSEVEHLFLKTDVNNDGVLTQDEVSKRHETWLASQATDYGGHLQAAPSSLLRDEL